ncbi:hypothetical protein LZ189_07660, partial [Rhodovulum sulfidophilum]|nr:hypothetical protein [Rhodovulum sulfidophilum]
MRIRAALLLLAVLLPLPAAAEPSCHPLTHEGRGYVICSADPATDDLRLFLRTEQGGIYGSFGRVNQALAARGETLAFAMNAG